MQRILKRMHKIAERYGVSVDQKDAWFWIAYCLATEHAPEFKPRPGAPPKWSFWYELLLIRDIQAREAIGQSVAEACDHLIKKRPWKELVGEHSKRARPGNTLRERYVRLMSERRKSFETKDGMIDIWEIVDGNGDAAKKSFVAVPDSIVRKWGDI